jgi:pimeloyl-ACP methyl ester carboxylesterase
MWKKFAIAVLAALLVLVALAALALRDNPARPAVGERRSATSAALAINYFSSGPAAAVPIVLLPSYARSVSDFNELVVALNGAGYRTIAMQPRGIDGSSLGGLNVTYHDYASDLYAVLEAEGISRPVVIIGHAYGNRLARTFASDYPRRVQGLVLLAAGGETATPPETSAAIVKALFGIFPDSSQRQAVQFAFFAEGNTAPDYWYRGWYPLAGLAQGNATAATPFAEWGAGGTAPMVVLQPLEDAAAADGAAQLLQRFPGRVTLHEIAHAGHALLPEQPALVNQLVLAAVAKLESTGE